MGTFRSERSLRWTDSTYDVRMFLQPERSHLMDQEFDEKTMKTNTSVDDVKEEKLLTSDQINSEMFSVPSSDWTWFFGPGSVPRLEDEEEVY